MGVRVASFVAAGGGLILGSDATGRFRAFEACSSNPGEIRSVGREARISHNTRPHLRVALSAALLVLLPSAMAESEASAQRATSDTGGLRAQVEAVATLAGEPQMVSAAGLTTDERPLLTLENRSAFDSSATERRLVLVGGLSGDAESARIVLDAVRWFKTAAPDRDRRRWVVSALPLAAPAASGRTQLHTFPPVDGFFNDADEPESRYVWRWVTYQAPDLVVEVRAGSEMTIQSSVESGARQADSLPAGSLAAALANQSNGTGLGAVESMLVTARFSDGATVMREALSRASGRRSALRGAIASRVFAGPDQRRACAGATVSRDARHELHFCDRLGAHFEAGHADTGHVASREGAAAGPAVAYRRAAAVRRSDSPQCGCGNDDLRRDREVS